MIAKRLLFSFFSSPLYRIGAGDLKSKLKHSRREAVALEAGLAHQALLKGSNKVVLTAMFSNSCIAGLKLSAAAVTGSPSMFAEGVHSLADLFNECLLFFGVMRASRTPDLLHPYGFSREKYAWSLISGVGIFFLGGGVSLYHGVSGLLHPCAPDNLHYAFTVLCGSLLFEGYTGLVAYRHVRAAALDSGISVLDYVRRGPDPTAVQILLEDTAAVSGVCIAGGSLLATHFTGNPMFDSCGSISIGLLLGATAIFLIKRNLGMIVETSMPKERENMVVETLLIDPVIKSVHDVKSTNLGMDGARFKAEVQIDGKVIAKRCVADFEHELARLKSITTKDELESYLLRQGQNIIDQVAVEIDRIELDIKKKVPEVTHCDLEIL